VGGLDGWRIVRVGDDAALYCTGLDCIGGYGVWVERGLRNSVHRADWLADWLALYIYIYMYDVFSNFPFSFLSRNQILAIFSSRAS
jgi:hypothetical protein